MGKLGMREDTTVKDKIVLITVGTIVSVITVGVWGKFFYTVFGKIKDVL